MRENSDRLKICHICSYYENLLFHHLVTEQMEYTDPFVFFFKPYGVADQYHLPFVHEIPCFRSLDRFFFSRKERSVYQAYVQNYGEKEIDLNFAHSLFANGYIAYRAKKDRAIPYVVMVQNTDLNVFYRYRLHLRGVGTRILLEADGIVFASAVYRDTLLKKYVPAQYREAIRKKSVVIPYGIEPMFFEARQEEKQARGGGETKCLSVGLICGNKNHLALCRAIEKLNRKGNRLHLTVIGKVQNEAIAKNLRQYDFVTLQPFMPKEQLIRYYRQADIFALTSLTETFGLVYAEALSQGLPILYSKGQGFDGQFEEGYVGCAVDARSVDDIAAGLERVLLRRDEMKRHTAEAARHFQWGGITEQYLRLYDRVIKGRNEA